MTELLTDTEVDVWLAHHYGKAPDHDCIMVQRLANDRVVYCDFIERLARTELHVVPDDLLDMLPRWHSCPHCIPMNTATHATEALHFTHADGCPVVGARKCLGLPIDERGHLVEGR